MRSNVLRSAAIALSAVAALGAATDHAAAFSLPIGIYNNSGGASLSGLNVTMNVSDGGSFAIFSIQNASSGVNAGAVVTSLYFESTQYSNFFLGAGSLVTPFDPGVNYSTGSSPANPAAGGLAPSWSGNKFTASPSSPPPVNGINSGEQLSVKFSYLNGLDFASLTSTLSSNPDAFRVAMHIQNVGENGQSVWGTSVPAPGAAALLGLAAVVGGARRRR